MGAFRRLTTIIFCCDNFHIKEPIEVRIRVNVNKNDWPKFTPAQSSTRGLFAKEFQTTTFVNDETEQNLGLTHHEMCKFQVSTAQLKIESFVNILVDYFWQEVEETLLHASIPIPGHPVERTAIGLWAIGTQMRNRKNQK